MRAWLFAMVCVGLSLGAHDLMAPVRVPLWSVAAAVAAVTVIGHRLAGRRRSGRSILTGVQAGQLYLHFWFTWTTPAGPGSAYPPHASHLAGHGAHIAAMSPHGMSTLMMLAGHLVAGVIVALWLAAGERAVWRALASLVQVLRGRVSRMLAPIREDRVPELLAGTGRDDSGHRPSAGAVLRHAVIRRGPPIGHLLSVVSVVSVVSV